LVVAVPVPGRVVVQYVTVFTTVLPGGGALPETATPTETIISKPVETQPAKIETTNETTPTEASTTEIAPTTEAKAPAPTTSTTSTTPTSTSTTPTATPSTSTGGEFSGEGTYYDPEMGACGIVNSGDEKVVAISQYLFDKYTPNGNPNKNSLCGKKINASYEGKTVEVTIVDRCVGCKEHDLDLSPSAFADIADKGLGRIDITWEWA
jgi:Predicted solute binding protein